MFMSSYRYFRMARQLAELTEKSVELAQHLKRQAEFAETAKAKADLAAAFAAIADEVARSVALEARLLREAREAALTDPRRRPRGREIAQPDAAPADPAGPKIVKH
jgi:hypothetical protein